MEPPPPPHHHAFAAIPSFHLKSALVQEKVIFHFTSNNIHHHQLPQSPQGEPMFTPLPPHHQAQGDIIHSRSQTFCKLYQLITHHIQGTHSALVVPIIQGVFIQAHHHHHALKLAQKVHPAHPLIKA
jgi:hypothetical protein